MSGERWTRRDGPGCWCWQPEAGGCRGTEDATTAQFIQQLDNDAAATEAVTATSIDQRGIEKEKSRISRSRGEVAPSTIGIVPEDSARGRDPRGVAGRSIDEYRAAAVEAATKTTRRCTAQRDAFGRTLQVNESEAALLGSRARHFSGTVPCDAFTQIPGFYV